MRQEGFHPSSNVLSFKSAPGAASVEAISSSSNKTSKKALEPILTYKRSRKIPALNPAGPSPHPGALNLPSPVVSAKVNRKEEGEGRILISAPKPQPEGNHLTASKVGLDPCLTVIGSSPSLPEVPSPLLPSDKAASLLSEGKDLAASNVGPDPHSLASSQKEKSSSPLLLADKAPHLPSQKGEKRKQTSPLSWPVEIPEVTKKRRTTRHRPNKDGLIKNGWVRASAMQPSSSSSMPSGLPQRILPNCQDIQYNLRRTRQWYVADASPAVAGSRTARQAGAGDKRKLTISLSSKEIAEDFYQMTSRKPPRKPTKRPRKIQDEIDVSTSSS